MAAKKPAVQEKVKKAKPVIAVKIPKQVSSSNDKVWRRLMINAIKEQAHMARYGNRDKAGPSKTQQSELDVE